MKGDNEQAGEFRCARCNRLDFCNALDRDTHTHSYVAYPQRRIMVFDGFMVSASLPVCVPVRLPVYVSGC